MASEQFQRSRKTILRVINAAEQRGEPVRALRASVFSSRTELMTWFKDLGKNRDALTIALTPVTVALAVTRPLTDTLVATCEKLMPGEIYPRIRKFRTAVNSKLKSLE